MAELGKSYFSQNCAACHQANGAGLPGAFPPLAKSEYVDGGSRHLGMILLKGLQGTVTVEGKVYNSAMPAWEKALTDKKIAAILTYVRSDFGNSAPPITPEQIADARKEYAGHPDPFTEAELKAVPMNAELPGGAPAGGAKP